MAYKAALFDLDDTLLESSRVKWLQHQTVAKQHYDIVITDDTMREVWGMPLSLMIEASYQGVAPLDEILEHLMACEPEYPKGVLRGAPSAIDALLDGGLEVGVVTSAPTQRAIDDLVRHGFGVDRMFSITGYDHQPAHKPDPAVFDEPLQALKSKGISSHEVVYVGDLLVDLEAATRAGLAFVGVTSGIHSADRLRAGGADSIVPGVAEAVALILGA